MASKTVTRSIFPSLNVGGGGGGDLNFSSILSNIVINRVEFKDKPLQFPQEIQISSVPLMLVHGSVDLSLQEHSGSWSPI